MFSQMRSMRVRSLGHRQVLRGPRLHVGHFERRVEERSHALGCFAFLVDNMLVVFRVQFLVASCRVDVGLAAVSFKSGMNIVVVAVTQVR